MRENDRRKFVELAEKRVSKTLRDIHLIGNLSNRSNYQYVDEDVEKIFKALHAELRACRKRFEAAKNHKGSGKFSLDD